MNGLVSHDLEVRRLLRGVVLLMQVSRAISHQRCYTSPASSPSLDVAPVVPHALGES